MSHDEGRRRHLPPWMLCVTAKDPAGDSGSEFKCKENDLEELPAERRPRTSEGEVKQQSSDVATSQSESTEMDSGFLKKCKTTRSRRKLAKRAEDCVSNTHECELEKENYAPRSRRKVKVSRTKGSNASEESTLSEDELGVDDLISIAEEYMNAGKGEDRQKSFAVCESESLHLSMSSEDKSTQKEITPFVDGISIVNTSEASSSDLVERQLSERCAISSSKTGDPAQDMLDLFLGPLLKRTDEIKWKPEPLNKSVTLDYVSSNQTQDGPVGAVIPLVKKKGSLKDKVAMLLS